MPGSKITGVSSLSLLRVFISLFRPPQRRTLSHSTLPHRASEFLVGPGWCCLVSKSTKHQVSRARGLQMKVPSRHNHHPPPALSCICSPTTSPLALCSSCAATLLCPGGVSVVGWVSCLAVHLPNPPQLRAHAPLMQLAVSNAHRLIASWVH